MEFHLLDSSQVDWDKLDSFDDRLVYQTREWLEFLADSQRATPVVAALHDGARTVGYFSGLVLRRAGIRILGSPFTGWTTSYMGFNLLPEISRSEALQALERFAFRELNCLHLEVADQFASVQDGTNLGYSCTIYDCLYTDLTVPEETLLRNFAHSCRKNLRRAEESGIQIEEAQDERFADDYYDQLKDVFARQKLIPTFERSRTAKMIRHLLPTGRLLLLRARDREGNCIATGIYAGLKGCAEFWGNASFISKQHLRPNEAIHWHAIRHWKAKGMERLSWGPSTAFKEKWDVTRVSVPWFRKSRYPWIEGFRKCAKNAFDLRQRFLGGFSALSRGQEPTEISR